MMLKIMISLKSINKLLFVSFVVFLVSSGFVKSKSNNNNHFNNSNNNDSFYIIKDWSNPNNCTGNIIRFFSFYENQINTEIMGAKLNCSNDNNNNNEISCSIISQYYELELYKQGQCINGKTLDYFKNIQDFKIFDLSNYCLISEFNNSDCNFKPNFNLGQLNNECIDGLLLNCKSPSSEYINTCEIIVYDQESSGTLIVSSNENFKDFPMSQCKDSIGNYKGGEDEEQSDNDINNNPKGFILHNDKNIILNYNNNNNSNLNSNENNHNYHDDHDDIINDSTTITYQILLLLSSILITIIHM